MPRKLCAALILSCMAVFLGLAGCSTKAPPASPSAQPVPATHSEPTLTPTVIESDVIDNVGLLISELQPGVPGNNNQEFIELYNAGRLPIDLQDWSLWYQLDDNQDAQLVKAWESKTDVPGLGHYLLGRVGHAIGTTADSSFDVPLFERKGGLALKGPDGKTIDALVWGSGPKDYISGTAAPVPEGGGSLERLPGGEAGNGTESGDNGADFARNPAPKPQNSGAPITPWEESRMEIQLSGPISGQPGEELTYTVAVRNLTGAPMHDVRATLPVPEGFEVVSIPAGATESQGNIDWLISGLADGASQSGAITLQSPWTYLTDLMRGYFVETPEWPMRTYGEPLPLSIAGGSVPIAIARGLIGQNVTVEGIATMYTGGFFAGSTGTKFYLEDETGGIQVYCPGGKGQVDVSVGDRVRVTGEIEAYRDSIEIIPSAYPDDVETVERNSTMPNPKPVSLQAARGDEDVLGRLVTVEGTASRIEEFSYSYEIDLLDDQGSNLLVYIEKDTGVTVEPLEVGKEYRATGISELYSGIWQIKPRVQTDLSEIFPPELVLTASAPNSVLPGEKLTVTLTAYNHTSGPLTNVRFAAPQPTGSVSTTEIMDGGQLDGSNIFWTIPELAANGESATVRYWVTVDDDAMGQVSAKVASVNADEWPDPAESGPLLTFIGVGVPIWAVQGNGMASPYVRSQATTVGVVTGVFPGLDGFWIQEAKTDDDPATSAGLFVLTDGLNIPVQVGDQVRVTGKVRERSGQTTLHVERPDNVAVLKFRA